MFYFRVDKDQDNDLIFKANMQKITPDRFSLLKFANQDNDFSLNCLAGNLTESSEYISVHSVSCDSKIANAYLCFNIFSECRINSYFGEPLDLLFNPAFAQDQANYSEKN